jgi:DNA-binding protein HU-beta
VPFLFLVFTPHQTCFKLFVTTTKGESRMNKAELIEKTAAKAGLTKKNAETAINTMLEVITEALADREKVQLPGFGTFETRERAERTGRNPATGEEITIPATTIPAFKAGKNLKELVHQE